MIAWTIYVTFGGAFLLLFLPHVLARWMALLTTVTGFAITLKAFFDSSDNATFKTIVQLPWIRTLGFEYHLAVDGISLTLALVTAITAVSAVRSAIQRARTFGRNKSKSAPPNVT